MAGRGGAATKEAGNPIQRGGRQVAPPRVAEERLSLRDSAPTFASSALNPSA